MYSKDKMAVLTYKACYACMLGTVIVCSPALITYGLYKSVKADKG